KRERPFVLRPIHLGFKPNGFVLALGQFEGPDKWNVASSAGGIWARDRPAPYPRERLLSSRGMWIERLKLVLGMSQNTTRVVPNVLGQSSRAWPRTVEHRIITDSGIHRTRVHPPWRDLQSRLVD